MERRKLCCLLFVALLAVPGGATRRLSQQGGCSVTLKGYDQCGGLSGCAGARCVDGQWPGACCPAGYKCTKNDAYFYNCQPTMHAWDAAAGGGGGGQAPARKVDPLPPVPFRRQANGDPAYADALTLALLFFAAQRSGRLPPDNPIAWRGDSGVDDRAPDGRDVSGGYYDAGDNVKFNLPMAWTAAVLAWSVYDFKEGYEAAGQYGAALGAIRWAADYFVKCVGDGSSIVVQVGSGNEDHASWQRAEDKAGPNRVYTIDAAHPGADVAGAMAAALAAASVVFQPVDKPYSDRLLAAALKAYNFALQHPGLYNDAAPDAAQFYRSSNALDDVAWAAVWLGLRTGEAGYREVARTYYYRHWETEEGPKVWNNFDWDSNSWGDVVMLARWYPDDAFLKKRMGGFIEDWLVGGDWIKKTPKGLGFASSWGNLRHVATAVFLMKAYAKHAGDPALERRIDCFAHHQMDLILGGTPGGRSFVVGYGPNPPQQPHHRSASCPPLGQPCGWDFYQASGPNPHVIYGALVGGPDLGDAYDDRRGNFQQTEVAMDYNGGFAAALAAMVKPSIHAGQCGGGGGAS